MARRTLIDFFADSRRDRGEFLVYDDGYRTLDVHLRRAGRGGARVCRRACATPASPGAARSPSGARTAPSGSSRSGAACSTASSLVPIDYRASPDFLARVAAIVDARAVLVGDAVDVAAVWTIAAGLDAGGV